MVLHKKEAFLVVLNGELTYVNLLIGAIDQENLAKKL